MQIKHPYRYFWESPPPERHDIKILLDGFETIDSTSAERAERIRSLLSEGGKDQKRLAKKLARCKKCYRCGSAACPKCFRLYRRWLMGEVLRIFKDRPDVYVVTLVFTKLRLAEGDLFEVDPERMMWTLCTQLIRSKVGHVIAVGGVEADFDVETGKWEPHIHVIICGCSVEELDALRHYYKAVPEVLKPMVVQEVEDPVEQFSYCRKSYFARKEKYWAKYKGEYRKYCRKVRLRPDSLHNLSLLFLDQFAPDDLLFLRNIRREGSKLVVKAVSEKSS